MPLCSFPFKVFYDPTTLFLIDTDGEEENSSSLPGNSSPFCSWFRCIHPTLWTSSILLQQPNIPVSVWNDEQLSPRRTQQNFCGCREQRGCRNSTPSPAGILFYFRTGAMCNRTSVSNHITGNQYSYCFADAERDALLPDLQWLVGGFFQWICKPVLVVSRLLGLVFESPGICPITRTKTGMGSGSSHSESVWPGCLVLSSPSPLPPELSPGHPLPQLPRLDGRAVSTKKQELEC